MLFSTARAIVNRALLGLGNGQPIATDAIFNNGVMDLQGNISLSGLDKYQSQAIIFYSLILNSLGLVMSKRQFWRKYQFQTSAPDATTGDPVPQYTLENGLIEGFRANSVFNVTYGAGPGNRLHVVPYQNFLESYARPDIIPIGTPMWLVPLPADDSGNVVVQLVPSPDQVYTIEYQCRLIVPPLKTGADMCPFPYHHEHALVFKLIEYLETRVNEGREQGMRQYAEQFIAEMMRDAAGADEENDRIDMGMRLYGNYRESARDYNPETDVPAAYP